MIAENREAFVDPKCSVDRILASSGETGHITANPEVIRSSRKVSFSASSQSQLMGGKAPANREEPALALRSQSQTSTRF